MEEVRERIIPVNIETEMKTAYIDYSMSVIVSRALPDVRDGLKPVQRRILYGMREMGLYHNKAYKKSARIVGEVMGKYHPHGDSSVYFALVRLAQPWSMRYPLVDGQGNFGSMDDDPPAAMRYTEARLTRISQYLLYDIEKDTVDFQPNFDDSLKEPVVLPTRIPNLLVNGTSGIAVGMATNMPPHNLSDTIDAIVAYIDNKDIGIEELIDIIKAPDFPTGGIIYGYKGVRDAYLTGRGRIVIRAKHQIEYTKSGKPQIVFTEIPYQVNKAAEIAKIGDLVNKKKIDGIVHANDESDRKGIRVVITLRKDANPNVVLNKIFKYTQFETTFNVNNIALVKGRPKLLNLKDLIRHFVDFRHEIVVRRAKYELKKAEERAHILEGLLKALDFIDEVIALIRASENPEQAKHGLMERFDLTEVQAQHILSMRLQQLTALERQNIQNEYDEKIKLINYLREVLSDEGLRMKIIKDELLEVKELFGDERRTEIEQNAEEFNPEDFYENKDVVITISNLGYIKRTDVKEYRAQNRGGKGSKAAATRDEDFIRYAFVASMHSTMLFFTDKGKVFWLKVYEIPEGTRTSKGRHIQNLLQIEADDSVVAYLNIKNLNDEEFLNSNYIVLATERGIVKKTLLKEYSRPRRTGITAIVIKENDKLISAELTDGNSDIMLASRHGKAIRFHESDVRAVGRAASGVKGMNISDDDKVVSMVCVKSDGDCDILVVAEHGYGKRSKLEDYRVTGRGGKGVKTINISNKTGLLAGMEAVTDDDDLMVITKKGQSIRIHIRQLRVLGRAAQGVRLINLSDGDQIATIARIKGGAVEDQDEDQSITEGIEEVSNDGNLQEDGQGSAATGETADQGNEQNIE